MAKHSACREVYGVPLRRMPEFVVWYRMLARCYDRNDRNYRRYGARGVTVCDRWRPRRGQSYQAAFLNFVKDVGRRPPGHTLERKKNKFGYSPNNCRGATYSEQNNNKRNNVLLSFNGETMTMMQWARRQGLSFSTLKQVRMVD